MRDFAGSTWRINIDDPLDTRIYVSADDGQVLVHRNSRWSLVDFSLMLHFMDYLREDSVNNPQIIVIGFGTLWLAVSGLLLVFYSFSRSDFLWLPGMKSGGVRVNGTLSYYASLSRYDIKLPSNCDGSGSCGLCRVRYEGDVPEHAAVDREWIDSAALSEGMRLACQHKPRSGDVVVVPDIAFQQSLQWGRVISSRWLTPLLKEIRLQPGVFLRFDSGDYLQFQVPAGETSLQQLAVP